MTTDRQHAVELFWAALCGVLLGIALGISVCTFGGL